MKIAPWLLSLLGSDDALVGDLLERRAERSSLWLWTQTAAAIAATSYRAIRSRPEVALVTAAATVGFLIVWVQSTLALYLWLSRAWMNEWAGAGATWVGGVRVGGAWSRMLFLWWEVYGGGLSVIWCVGAAWIGRTIMRHTSLRFAIVAALSALPVSVWHGAPMWHPSYGVNWIIVASFVLIGIPAATMGGALSVRTSRSSRVWKRA
jgi:hypothetical protein